MEKEMLGMWNKGPTHGQWGSGAVAEAHPRPTSRREAPYYSQVSAYRKTGKGNKAHAPFTARARNARTSTRKSGWKTKHQKQKHIVSRHQPIWWWGSKEGKVTSPNWRMEISQCLLNCFFYFLSYRININENIELDPPTPIYMGIWFGGTIDCFSMQTNMYFSFTSELPQCKQTIRICCNCTLSF